jgi:hypothetical protein
MKTTMKKLLSAVLTVALVISFAPAAWGVVPPGTPGEPVAPGGQLPSRFTVVGDWMYNNLVAAHYGTVAITQYTGPGGHVVIPATLDGYPVTGIEAGVFRDNTSLTSVVIPDSVRGIGVRAFYGCTSLTSVNIPGGVTFIGPYAFSGCTSLTSVAIPDSVTVLGMRAFLNCTSLTNLTISSGVTEIEDGTFSNTSLTSVVIPDGVTFIGFGAFSGINSLTSVTIPSSITHMGIPTFAGSNEKNLTIRSYANSYAQTFAKDRGYKFEAITGAYPTQTTPPTPTTPSPGNAVNVIFNGSPLSFDVPPQMMNGRTMVPLRAIFEAMGAEIEWDNATQTATATKGDTVVILTVGSTTPTVNGQVVPLDQPGVIVGGRTLAPLRFVAEAFGGTVAWDGATQTATITSQP